MAFSPKVMAVNPPYFLIVGFNRLSTSILVLSLVVITGGYFTIHHVKVLYERGPAPWDPNHPFNLRRKDKVPRPIIVPITTLTVLIGDLNDSQNVNAAVENTMRCFSQLENGNAFDTMHVAILTTNPPNTEKPYSSAYRPKHIWKMDLYRDWQSALDLVGKDSFALKNGNGISAAHILSSGYTQNDPQVITELMAYWMTLQYIKALHLHQKYNRVLVLKTQHPCIASPHKNTTTYDLQALNKKYIWIDNHHFHPTTLDSKLTPILNISSSPSLIISPTESIFHILDLLQPLVYYPHRYQNQIPTLMRDGRENLRLSIGALQMLRWNESGLLQYFRPINQSHDLIPTMPMHFSPLFREIMSKSNHTSSDFSSQNRTLVAMLGNLRGGNQTWESFYHKVLAVNPNTDLALIVGTLSPNSPQNSSFLYNLADYVWEFPEYDDWADAINLIGTPPAGAIPNNFTWEHIMKQNYWSGILGGARDSPGSGAIVLYTRWYLAQMIKLLSLHKTYSRFVVTRSDNYYLCNHNFSTLSLSKIHIVKGNDHRGYNDRHIIANHHHILPLLDQLPSMVWHPERYTRLTLNPEAFLKLRISEQGLEKYVERFDRVMFVAALAEDQTRWSVPGKLVPEGVHLKYPEEYDQAKATCKSFEQEEARNTGKNISSTQPIISS